LIGQHSAKRRNRISEFLFTRFDFSRNITIPSQTLDFLFLLTLLNHLQHLLSGLKDFTNLFLVRASSVGIFENGFVNSIEEVNITKDIKLGISDVRTSAGKTTRDARSAERCLVDVQRTVENFNNGTRSGISFEVDFSDGAVEFEGVEECFDTSSGDLVSRQVDGGDGAVDTENVREELTTEITNVVVAEIELGDDCVGDQQGAENIDRLIVVFDSFILAIAVVSAERFRVPNESSHDTLETRRTVVDADRVSKLFHKGFINVGIFTNVEISNSVVDSEDANQELSTCIVDVVASERDGVDGLVVFEKIAEVLDTFTREVVVGEINSGNVRVVNESKRQELDRSVTDMLVSEIKNRESSVITNDAFSEALDFDVLSVESEFTNEFGSEDTTHVGSLVVLDTDDGVICLETVNDGLKTLGGEVGTNEVDFLQGFILCKTFESEKNDGFVLQVRVSSEIEGFDTAVWASKPFGEVLDTDSSQGISREIQVLNSGIFSELSAEHLESNVSQRFRVLVSSTEGDFSVFGDNRAFSVGDRSSTRKSSCASRRLFFKLRKNTLELTRLSIESSGSFDAFAKFRKNTSLGDVNKVESVVGFTEEVQESFTSRVTEMVVTENKLVQTSVLGESGSDCNSTAITNGAIFENDGLNTCVCGDEFTDPSTAIITDGITRKIDSLDICVSAERKGKNASSLRSVVLFTIELGEVNGSEAVAVSFSKRNNCLQGARLTIDGEETFNFSHRFSRDFVQLEIDEVKRIVGEESV
jgi:hypothetical protein